MMNSCLSRVSLATVKFQNPPGHMVKEISVVGNRNNCTLILLQVLFQPVNRLGVKVVGRLIKQQYIRLLQQQPTQRDTAALTTGKSRYLLVVRRALEGIHRTLQLRVNIPRICRVYAVLQFGLAGHQRIHLVRVFKNIRISERLIDLFILRKKVKDGLHTFPHHLYHRLFRVKLRVLFQVSYRISRRKHHFALVALVKPGDNLQQRRLT